MIPLLKRTVKNSSGFTVLELIIVITLLAFVLGITLTGINYGYFSAQKKQVANKIMSDLSVMESGFTSYAVDRNAYPSHSSNLLLDSNFVPRYLNPPTADENFDTTYGLNGYLMFNNDHGYYICAKAPVKGSSDLVYQAIKIVAGKLPATKFYYNTECAAQENMSDPDSSTTVYITYWLILSE